MIHAKIDDERFLDLVRSAPVIAYQGLQHGLALAAPGCAYYAPVKHPGGGNLQSPITFTAELGEAFILRMGRPELRTLRPTAKPQPTAALLEYLRSFNPSEPWQSFGNAAGDHPAMIESQCQSVIQAIVEFERPDLKLVWTDLKRDVMSDALDLVIDHATWAHEQCDLEVGTPDKMKMHILQASRALQSALSLLLKP